MITTKYILFAVISTVINIVTQFIAFKIYSGLYALYTALVAGTLAGLLAKYFLDKNYIFYHKSHNLRAVSENFVLYSVTGVIKMHHCYQ